MAVAVTVAAGLAAGAMAVAVTVAAGLAAGAIAVAVTVLELELELSLALEPALGKPRDGNGWASESVSVSLSVTVCCSFSTTVLSLGLALELGSVAILATIASEGSPFVPAISLHLGGCVSWHTSQSISSHFSHFCCATLVHREHHGSPVGGDFGLNSGLKLLFSFSVVFSTTTPRFCS